MTTVIASAHCKSAAQSLAQHIGVLRVTTAAPIPEATFGGHTPAPPSANITVVLGSDYTVPAQTAEGGSSDM